MNHTKSMIAVIGLGYVGLPLAVEFGKQRPVIGFDINPARIAELQAAKTSTLEVHPRRSARATTCTTAASWRSSRSLHAFSSSPCPRPSTRPTGPT